MKKCSINGLLKDIFVLFLFIVILHLIFNSLFAKREFVTKELVVMRGETLWSIASDLLDEEKSEDINHIIYDIKELNNMTDSTVYEGQIIYIPVYSI